MKPMKSLQVSQFVQKQKIQPVMRQVNNILNILSHFFSIYEKQQFPMYYSIYCKHSDK